jgi:hypothetical protein
MVLKKKLLLLLIISIYQTFLSIDYWTAGFFAVNQICHIISGLIHKNKININSDTMNFNTLKFCLYREHLTPLLKEIRLGEKEIIFDKNPAWETTNNVAAWEDSKNDFILAEYSTWMPALITSLIYFFNQPSSNTNNIRSQLQIGALFSGSCGTTYCIKKYQRAETKNTIEKKLKNIFQDNTINDLENFKITNSDFFIQYIIFLLYNQTQEQKYLYLDIYSLYEKIYKIEHNIALLKKNNFKTIASKASVKINNTIKIPDEKSFLINILMPQFNNEITEIADLLTRCIEITNNLNIHVLSYLNKIENEEYINIESLTNEINDFITTMPSIDFTSEAIDTLSLKAQQLHNKVLTLKTIKNSPGYSTIKNVIEKIQIAKDNKLISIGKEASFKLKELTNKISLDYYEYILTDDFIKNINNLNHTIDTINIQQKILNELITNTIDTISQNNHIDLSPLKKTIAEYEEIIKHITLENAELTLNNYIKTVKKDTKKYGIFFESLLSNKHKTLYNIAEEQYSILKNKHFSENTLIQELLLNQLDINNSNSIIEEKICNLEKLTKETSLIISIVNQIEIKKNSISQNREKYNEIISNGIFNNFPKKEKNFEKSYYSWNYNQLITHENYLKKKIELLEKNINILYTIQDGLREYMANTNEINKKITAITSLGIYNPYIKDTRKYKTITKKFKKILSQKIEYNNNIFDADLYKNIVKNMIDESKKCLEVINIQYNNYYQVERYNSKCNAIIRQLPQINSYWVEKNPFILNQKKIFDNKILEIINDPLIQQPNYNTIEKIIKNLQDYSDIVAIEKKKIEMIESKIEKAKKKTDLCLSFNKDEKNNITKQYDTIKYTINEHFNSLLADYKYDININVEQHNSQIDRLRLIVISLDQDIIKAMNILKKLNRKKIDIETEEAKYNNLLTEYNIISTKDFFINAINAINQATTDIENYRKKISKKISQLSYSDNTPLVLEQSNNETIITLEKEYYNNNIKRKKIICNQIRNKLKDALEQIPDEKKAENSNSIETTTNELIECESSSIESINKISYTMNKTLSALLK